MSTTHGGEPWRWQAFNAAGHRKAEGQVDPRRVWWAEDAQQVADYGLAQLLVRAAPRYQRLAGWSVTAWRPDSGPAWAYADDWLAMLRQGAVDRLRRVG